MLPGGSEQRTMTTLEIADLIGKRHDNAMRDTRNMLVERHGEGGHLRFEAPYRAGNGKMEACYALPYDETMILITGYSIPLRAAVVRRWRELEEAKPALLNFADSVAAARASLVRLGAIPRAFWGRPRGKLGARTTVEGFSEIISQNFSLSYGT